MGGWNERVRIDSVVGHLAPLCRHCTKQPEGGERTEERNKDERLPFAQDQSKDLLQRRRYPDDVEAAELAKIKDKCTGNAARRGDAAAMWW